MEKWSPQSDHAPKKSTFKRKEKSQQPAWLLTFCGGDKEDRTPDLCVANAALSQLSYTPTFMEL